LPRIVERSAVASNVWDDIVGASPDGWVFSLACWQDLILAVPEWGFQEHSFALMDGDRIVAVVPLQFRPANGRMASSGWGGSGPVISGSLDAAPRDALYLAAMEECLARARQAGAMAFDVQLAAGTTTSLNASDGVNPLAVCGLEASEGLSQFVDLSMSEDDLWGAVAKSARWTIRKARKAGYRVERVDWRDLLDALYDIHVETYVRTGVPPHPRGYFEGMAAKTAPTGHSVLWAAFTAGGEPIAFHNDACFRGSAMYHTGCSRQAALDDGANYLLFWEAMIGARRAGIRWFDCGAVFPGATDPKQIGLTLFKTRFGGAPRRLFRASLGFQQVAAERVAPPAARASADPTRSPLLARTYGRIRRAVRAGLGH
jgi:hypothetical protein